MSNNNHKNNWKGNKPNPKANQAQQSKPKPKRRVQSKNFTIGLSGRHVFGAYFNMARTNFVKTINHILPIAGVKGNYAENQINKMLQALFLIQANRKDELSNEQDQWAKNLRLTSEQQTRLQRLLFKHFPVLGPIMADVADHKAYISKKKKSETKTEDEAFEELRGVSLADCLEIVQLMGTTLTECRNFYTHKKPYNKPAELAEQYRHQATIARKLDKVIVACRRVLKERENLSVNEVEFLTGIDHMKQVPKLDEDGKEQYDNRGRKIMKFEEYEDFYFTVWAKRPVKNLEMIGTDGLLTKIDTKLPALSDFGLLFFCVLFLSKPYAKLFIEEARLFEFSPFKEEENVIMREMMSIYRIRTPRLHRIDSRDSKATLAMDIFGELRRCPIELYDLLDKNQGQPFFHDVVQKPNDHTPEVSKRLRYDDRFPHLALRYIDETGLFTRIRFQLQLGAFRYKFYDKTCVDGRVRVRRIQKDINGYGRLQEVAEEKMNQWGDLVQKREEQAVKLEHEDLYIDLDQFLRDAADTTPYVTDRRPAYNIHANRIGLFWERDQNPQKFEYFDKVLAQKSEAERRFMYIPKLSVDEDGKAPIQMPAPRCALSVYDLPAMLFYEYLRAKNIDDKELPTAEKLIIDCEDVYRKFFKAVADGSLTPFENKEAFREHLSKEYPTLCLADIPEKLQLYLSSQPLRYKNEPETVRQRLVRLTLDHLGERELRLQRRKKHYEMIGNKDNKYGKKGFADVRYGALARYLARDMMEWQPTYDGKGHDKLTGLNFNVLTAYLATFGLPQAPEEGFMPRTLEQVLTEAHLLGGNNPHPFIDKVLAHKPRNIEDFYLFYLNEELQHIDSCKQTLKNAPTDDALAALPFVHHERSRFHDRTKEEIQLLASRYETIQLPDGLFTPHIVNILRKHYADNVSLQEALNNDAPNKLNPTHNAGYLITRFYQTVLKDNAQPFYNTATSFTRHKEKGQTETFSFKRAYELFSVLQNDKETFFPYELKPLFQTSDEIQERLSAKRLNEFGEPMAKLSKKGKDERDEQGNIMWQRQLTQEIEEYVNSLSDRDLKLSQNQSREEKKKEREEKREALLRRLTHQVVDVKNNERALRRYKTQDMVLFLLAKDMFVQLLSEQAQDINWKQMRLSKVCNTAFLRQTLTFRVPVQVGDKTIYVEQENMSLKNYGEFYRFLYDERLMSLLNNIIESIKPNKDGELVIRHTDLMGELAAYDQKRSAVFKLIQEIEDIVIKANSNLSDPNKAEFWAKEGLPRRNNFASMLELINKLKETSLTDEERKLLVAIRNAFGHNSYNIDLSLIKDIKKLPEVAKGILHHLASLLGVAEEELVKS